MVGFHESDDPCAICIHEHENWGDNKYCQKCEDKYSEMNNQSKLKVSEKER